MCFLARNLPGALIGASEGTPLWRFQWDYTLNGIDRISIDPQSTPFHLNTILYDLNLALAIGVLSGYVPASPRASRRLEPFTSKDARRTWFANVCELTEPSTPPQGIDPMNKAESGGDPVPFIFWLPTTPAGKIDAPRVVMYPHKHAQNAPTCPARSISGVPRDRMTGSHSRPSNLTKFVRFSRPPASCVETNYRRTVQKFGVQVDTVTYVSPRFPTPSMVVHRWTRGITFWAVTRASLPYAWWPHSPQEQTLSMSPLLFKCFLTREFCKETRDDPCPYCPITVFQNTVHHPKQELAFRPPTLPTAILGNLSIFWISANVSKRRQNSGRRRRENGTNTWC